MARFFCKPHCKTLYLEHKKKLHTQAEILQSFLTLTSGLFAQVGCRVLRFRFRGGLGFEIGESYAC